MQGSVGRLLSLGIDNVHLDLYLDAGNNTHCLELEELERRESCFHVWAAIDIVIRIVCSLRICSQITLKVAACTNHITSCPCKCLHSVATKLSSKSNFSTYVLHVLQNNPNLLHGALSLSTHRLITVEAHAFQLNHMGAESFKPHAWRLRIANLSIN